MSIKRSPSFRAAEGRVLFNHLAMEDMLRREVEDKLTDLGFTWSQKQPQEILAMFARNRLGGKSIYHRIAEPKDAPTIVNCSTFTKWCYGTFGVELPLLAIQQYWMGEAISDLNTLKAGDLIFKRGNPDRDYWDYPDSKIKIGHVGLVTDVNSADGEVIHAAQSAGGVVSAPLNEFIRKNGTFSAACRIVPDLPKWMVLNIPDTLKSRVKESNDVKLLIFEITSAKNTTP